MLKEFGLKPLIGLLASYEVYLVLGLLSVLVAEAVFVPFYCFGFAYCVFFGEYTLARLELNGLHRIAFLVIELFWSSLLGISLSKGSILILMFLTGTGREHHLQKSTGKDTHGTSVGSCTRYDL